MGRFRCLIGRSRFVSKLSVLQEWFRIRMSFLLLCLIRIRIFYPQHRSRFLCFFQEMRPAGMYKSLRVHESFEVACLPAEIKWTGCKQQGFCFLLHVKFAPLMT